MELEAGERLEGHRRIIVNFLFCMEQIYWFQIYFGHYWIFFVREMDKVNEEAMN